MPLRIEIHRSRILPILSLIFYSSLLSLPWLLPWGMWNLAWGVLALICTYPFFKQLKCHFKPEAIWIELCDDEISAVKTSDGITHPVSSFKALRLLVFYVELRLTVPGKCIRLNLFKDMLAGEDLCALRRFFNTLRQKADNVVNT